MPPSVALTTLRPDLGGSLEEFDTAADRAGYIAQQVFPVFEAGKPSGTYGKIPVEQLLTTRNTLRASGAGYARSGFTFTEASFATQEHGAEEPIDDRESQIYAEYFDYEMVATERARAVVLRNAEQRVADAVFNATTWSGAALATTVAVKWNVDATSDPRLNVSAAKVKVRDGSGLLANALIMTWSQFEEIVDSAAIIDRLKYAGFTDPSPATITLQALAQALNIDRIILAGGQKNTANEGATAVFADVWDKTMAMVCRVATSNDIQEPCIGRTLHYSGDGSQIGGTVETYREESTRSDIARVRHEVGEEVILIEAGHLLEGVL